MPQALIAPKALTTFAPYKERFPVKYIFFKGARSLGYLRLFWSVTGGNLLQQAASFLVAKDKLF